MIKQSTLVLIFLFLIGFAGTAISKPFVFSAIPDEDATRLKQRFDKVARYLATQLKIDVKFVPVKSYAAAVSAFKNNQVQMAWFGGLSGVHARRLVRGAVAIAQGWEDQSFVTYFIAHRSTGLAGMRDRKSKIGASLSGSVPFPKDIAGKTFTFGSKGSTSGRLMPEYHISKYFRKSPDRVFRRVGFSGDHSRTITLVQSGAYQVGAVNFKVWENELKAGKIDTQKVKIIWQTPPYPDYQWTIRGDVEKRWGAGFVAKVQSALIGMKDPDLLAAFPRSRFIPASNSDYEPILQTAKSIGLID